MSEQFPCEGCGSPVWLKVIQGPGVSQVAVLLSAVPGGGGIAAVTDPAVHGRFLAAGDDPVEPEQRWSEHACPVTLIDRAAAQREDWRKAQSALARAKRNQRGHRPAADIGPGMIRRSR